MAQSGSCFMTDVDSFKETWKSFDLGPCTPIIPRFLLHLRALPYFGHMANAVWAW